MWTHEESIEIKASPKQIWKLFSDVVNWKRWNEDVEIGSMPSGDFPQVLRALKEFAEGL